jgi:hypothetical protein
VVELIRAGDLHTWTSSLHLQPRAMITHEVALSFHLIKPTFLHQHGIYLAEYSANHRHPTPIYLEWSDATFEMDQWQDKILEMLATSPNILEQLWI